MTNPHHHDWAEVLPLMALLRDLDPRVVATLHQWPGVALANGLLENA